MSFSIWYACLNITYISTFFHVIISQWPSGALLHLGLSVLRMLFAEEWEYKKKNLTWSYDPATSFGKCSFPRSHKTWIFQLHWWKLLEYWRCMSSPIRLTWLWLLGQSKNMQSLILDRTRSVSFSWRCWNESGQISFDDSRSTWEGWRRG